MQFPVYLWVGGLPIHPHWVFESLGYGVAFRLMLRNVRTESIAFSQRSSVIVGGLVGALIGAKVLVLFQHWDVLSQDGQRFLLLLAQGKTVVGALLGALLGVELTKRWIGLQQSTGDVFVYPLIMGTAIGRVGCFLTGLSDRTYGTATSLPWGVDFGDGVLRHPTQLYEILFLLGLMMGLKILSRLSWKSGDLFKLYMMSYLTFRLGIDFIKPDFHPLFGLSAVQIVCVLGLVYYSQNLPRCLKFLHLRTGF